MSFTPVKKVGISLKFYNKILEGAKLGLFKVDDFLAYHFLDLEEIKNNVHLVCSVYTPNKSSPYGRLELGDRDCFYSKGDSLQASENIKKLTAQAAKNSEITGVVNFQLPSELLKNCETAWQSIKTESKTVKTWKIVKTVQQRFDGSIEPERDIEIGFLYKQEADAEAQRLNNNLSFPETYQMPLYVVRNEDESVTASVLDTDDYWKEIENENENENDDYFSDVAWD